MARAPISDDRSIEDVLDDTGAVTDDMLEAPEDSVPSYTLVGSQSIPVSKKAGKRWEERIKAALTATEFYRQVWQQAFIEYRKASHYSVVTHNTLPATNAFQNNTDENLTRENVKTILRNAYSKNPSVELTSIDTEDEASIDLFTQIVNQLVNRQNAPGINAKARVRRWIVHAHLTNLGILKLDYQAHSGSREEAQSRMLEIEEKLADAKDDEALEELYGELEAIEENLPVMRDAGMLLTNIVPGRLLIDPDTSMLNLSDSKWTAEMVSFSNAYIRNRFLEKNEDGVWVRKSDGKPVNNDLVTTDTSTTRDLKDDIIDRIIGTTDEEMAAVRAKDKTFCWIIWDKLTRQISLWIDGNWDYPLWVSRDDLETSRFFPYFLLAFSEPIDSIIQEGESAQYYGHVQEINKINKRVALIRMMAYGALIYNSKKINSDEVKKLISFMSNPNKIEAFGLDYDPETKLKDVFDLFIPPDGQIQALYDKSDLMRSVDRMNSISAVSRGEQFRTNTTNKAVEVYSQTQASVNNELTDIIEDSLADLFHTMLEIVVSKYSKEQIEQLVGMKMAATFENMSVREFNQRFTFEIAAGSTEKPTSDNKRREAIELSQAIGQVGQAAPATTLQIMFRMFRQAFNIFTFTREDEAMLTKEAQANLTKGVSTPQEGAAPPPQQ